VDFQFEQVGLMYDLASKITRKGWKGFDLVNLSGLLYHVFSPMHTLAGVRPLLRKNGLIIVSTNIVDRPGFSMEFNQSGNLQAELNTFWHLTAPLSDYILRYFKLRPIDALYHPHAKEDALRSTSLGPTGYLSVVCRAEDEVVSQSGDEWMKNAFLSSWERIALCNNHILSRQPASGIEAPQRKLHCWTLALLFDRSG
jgi:SAM-dependent methyltransferase